MPANTETRPWRHLYGRRWGRERLVHLARHPLCAMCEAKGQVTAATVVDHKQPHRGDAALFWDRSNWQSLCAPHHDRTKQIIEKAGAEAVHDIDGYKEGW
ncbi:MAG: HNH endonuclease signature motif containing protein [Saprospiraceae bacterium]